MLFIRPVESKDLDALLELSVEAGAGMTTMPNDVETWQKRIASSEKTFSNSADSSSEGVYFMVAQDSETNKIAGSAAVFVGVGSIKPFYSYKESLIVKYSHELKKTVEIPMLNLVNDYTRASEMASLFVRENYRHSAYGQFVSRSRYLLMFDFPDRFANKVIAELRGYQRPDGSSPFWQALGNKFFKITFDEADHVLATKGTQFVQDLMPKHPIYVDLLPEDARECIGKPHEVSAKAMNLLKKEGFHYDGYVHLFDGGPAMFCRKEQINSVRDAKVYTVNITDRIQDTHQRYVMSNQNIENYRVIAQPANIIDTTAEITSESAQVLGVQNGDTISLFAIKERKRA